MVLYKTIITKELKMGRGTKIYTEGSIWTGKYGDFTITTYKSGSKIKVTFLETNYSKYTSAKSVSDGTVKDPYFKNIFGVGCVGETPTSVSGKVKRSYHNWRDMIKRCYSPAASKTDPTYKDVTVCSDWLCFSEYEKWYEDNYVVGWELDKDLTVVGNKLYSPDTCVFVPVRINNLIGNKNLVRKTLPVGVSYHRRDKIYNAKCNVGKVLVHLGDYDCPEEARRVYVSYKSKHIQSVATEAFHNNEINSVVYKNLMDWKL